MRCMSMTKNAYFHFLTHFKQLLLAIFMIRLQELKLIFGHTNRKTDRQADVEVEIHNIKIKYLSKYLDFTWEGTQKLHFSTARYILQKIMGIS